MKGVFKLIVLLFIFLFSISDACRKDKGLSKEELLIASRWAVTDYCGDGQPNPQYIWTFKPDGQLIEIDGTETFYFTWSLKKSETILSIGTQEYKIISLSKTMLKLGGINLFDCGYVFTAIPL
jgi:hypothetical protein